MKRSIADCETDAGTSDAATVQFSVREGLRYVEPYTRTLECYAKGRWFGKNVLDVCAKEFRKYSREIYAHAAETGDLKILSFKTKDFVPAEEVKDYILSDNDKIIHKMHFVESPVPNKPIVPLFEDERILAVNKPAGWPVHPCGGYGENSITRELARLRPSSDGRGTLLPLHRLDRVTSGVLVFTKTPEIAAELSGMLASADEKKVKKIYVARVKGKFSDSRRVETFIQCLDHRRGVYAVAEDDRNQAKWSITQFEPLVVGEEESVVLCQPLTGRTHQIRVHLQHAGFPIVNDNCYGGVANDAVECGIYLHAWKYTISGWDEGDLLIEAPLPEWANA